MPGRRSARYHVERIAHPLVVSIGTTHPWNIAGAGLDARVCAELHCAHAMALAAVSAQDERGLRDVHVVPPDTLRAQLDSLPRDVAAYRVGALVSSETVRIVAEFLREGARTTPVVVDPVISVTLGGALQADGALLQTLRDELLTLPVIVTPNAPEAAQLLDAPADTAEAIRAAARTFVARGAAAALVKGGHLAGDPVDMLAFPGGEREFRAPRLPGAMRGSGCTLAAALACELAHGSALEDAVERARAYVRGKIAARTMRGGLQVAF